MFTKALLTRQARAMSRVEGLAALTELLNAAKFNSVQVCCCLFADSQSTLVGEQNGLLLGLGTAMRFFWSDKDDKLSGPYFLHNIRGSFKAASRFLCCCFDLRLDLIF